MSKGITAAIRTELEKRKQVTISELYDSLSKNPIIKIKDHILKHRIESIISVLYSRGEIKKVGVSTYKLSGWFTITRILLLVFPLTS